MEKSTNTLETKTTRLAANRQRGNHDAQTVVWREHRLGKLGLDDATASEVAREDVDIHEIEALRSRGCTMATALEILR